MFQANNQNKYQKWKQYETILHCNILLDLKGPKLSLNDADFDEKASKISFLYRSTAYILQFQFRLELKLTTYPIPESTVGLGDSNT